MRSLPLTYGMSWDIMGPNGRQRTPTARRDGARTLPPLEVVKVKVELGKRDLRPSRLIAAPHRAKLAVMLYDLAAFRASLADPAPPPGLSHALQALWLDGRGNFDAAHRLAQDDEGGDGDWVHAYLHRKEGDAGNAAYWYRRAGKPVAKTSLDEEWAAIAVALLAKNR